MICISLRRVREHKIGKTVSVTCKLQYTFAWLKCKKCFDDLILFEADLDVVFVLPVFRLVKTLLQRSHLGL